MKLKKKHLPYELAANLEWVFQIFIYFVISYFITIKEIPKNIY